MMTYNYASKKANLEFLSTNVFNIKEVLSRSSAADKHSVALDELADAIAQKLDYEEKTMEEIGLPLTPIHLEEHKKLLNEITLLEFSWNAKRISDDVYLKALNYKLEFHNHYFDQAQLLSFITKYETE